MTRCLVILKKAMAKFLVLFGEKITPNQHKLAKEFVLLDNFYVDGEVSADGHNWSMGAYATDYLEKTGRPVMAAVVANMMGKEQGDCQ